MTTSNLATLLNKVTDLTLLKQAVTSPYVTSVIVKDIVSVLDNNHANWRVKSNSLQLLSFISKTHQVQLSPCLPKVIPSLIGLIWDTKSEVRKYAREALFDALNTIQNRDLIPFLPSLYSAMVNIEEIPECIQALASTTFVQTVDSASLSVVVPLLSRALTESRVAIRRQCAVIIINMSKLVEDIVEIMPFLQLLPALKRAAEEIPDPEARLVATKAFEKLCELSNAEKIIEERRAALYETVLLSDAKDPELTLSICESLISCKQFDADHITEFVNPVAQRDMTLLLSQFGTVAAKTEDDAEELCNCKFTLAYGSKVLLHNTDLRLLRGKRYGLLGGNDSGKSTLLRAIANRQIDGFPPETELRTVLVEADIQGEMSHLACLDYVLSDERIKHCDRDHVAEIMSSVGFTNKMLTEPITSLSGGWRMKLALARAMLQNADILLLDEPTNHLDVLNVAWVQSYLNSLHNVTSIIVSHDAGLLNKCCTHIIQIDNLKLNLYKGDLTEFVKKVPSAMSFFSLAETKLKFKFPQPGPLDGVKSKGKALMKMAGVAFTYPGNDIPTISNITVHVSLSSRVACVGVNGAGKSTMIKLLTGQLEPNVGTVWKHPNCRVAYVAQHAFHHIEKHLTKSANEYIRWRYENGEDKEGLEKISLKLTPEEIEQCKKPLLVEIDEKKVKKVVDKLTGGRRTGKKEFEYEVLFDGGEMLYLPQKQLEDSGFAKYMKLVDTKIEARDGLYGRTLTQENVEKHLADVGLEPEFGTHNRIAALSGGQKVKIVLAAAMWNQPHILILDEPTNYLDRDSLGALAGAIQDYEGGVVMITHNNEFCSTLCPETWVLEGGRLDCKGDPDWMLSVSKETVEFKPLEDVIDGNGNIVKLKTKNKKALTRKEKMAREKRRKNAIELGEQISDDEDDEDGA